VSVAYKVLAPCVILENEEGVRREVYQGAVVEILPKQVDHLLGLGFIAKNGTADAVIPPEGAADPDSFPVAVSTVPPAKTAPVKAWEDYAVSVHGANRAEAEALSKSELIELFG
jgi:hypothetical protein